MAGKSTGQILGTVAGAAVGFATGGSSVALYASIGGLVGGLIDPPKGANTFGPRLDDLTVQTSTYGAPLGRAYGTVMVSGNLYWLEGDKLREHTNTEKQGGKGGGGAQYTSYAYTATFAVGLLRISDPTQIAALRRLWVGDVLIYDAGSNNVDSIIASNSQASGFTFYNGADAQPANPRMQADKGAANVSAYPGLVHIDFDDLDLTPYSNTLLRAQVRAELVIAPTTSIQSADLWHEWEGSTGLYGVTDELRSTASKTAGTGSSVIFRSSTYNGDPVSLVFKDYEYPASRDSTAVDLTALDWGYAYRVYRTTQADAALALTGQIPNSGSTDPYFRLFSPAGLAGASIGYLSQPGLVWHSSANVVFDAGDIFISPDNVASGKVQKITVDGLVQSSASYSYPGWLGASANYIFVAIDTNVPSQIKIARLSRSTLIHDATWTVASEYTVGSFFVADDSTVYVASAGGGHPLVIRKIVGGAVVNTWVDPSPVWIGDFAFKVFSDSQLYVVAAYRDGSGPYDTRGVVIAGRLAATAASLREIVIAECGLVELGSGDLDLDDLTDSAVRGFMVVNLGAVRAPLEQLQAAFPFDVMQAGYKVRFVSRGSASVASIPEADLGTGAGGEQHQTLLPVTREMDSQIAARVTVRYLDPSREYDVGEQFAERPATASAGEHSVDLAVVLIGTEAAQIADVLNQKDWLERRDFGPFSIPPTYRHLEPADVVTLAHRGQSHTLRLTRVEYLPDGRLSCMARQTSAACYTSTATGEEPLVLGQSLVPLKGSTAGYLLDIPRIRAEQDVPGMAFGLLGRASGWPGGALLRSDDSGNTWISAGATNTNAHVFQCDSALAAHHGYSPDFSSVLTVTPITPDAALYSVTEEQFYSQANLAAYGADGRWEIISFRSAVDNTGTFTLRDFLRGLYGSEWASGLHVPGDLLIMLDTATVGFFGLPTNALGSPRLYRAVTQGSAIDSAAEITDTYEAANLKPLAPVDLNGYRNPVTLDWTLKPQRRSRWQVELFSGQGMPLGESSEAYEIDVYTADFSEKKRTLSGASADISYPADQQISDFGSEQSTIYGEAFQISSIVGRGFRDRFQIYRYLPLDPYAEYLVLGLHMDGADGSTTFTDVCGHAMTAVGGAKISTARYKYGGASGLLNGSTDWITTPDSDDWTLGNRDFTIRGFGYLAAYPQNNAGVYRATIVAQDVGGSRAFGFGLYGTSSSYTQLSFIGFDAGYVDITASATPALNTWHHFEVCRSGNLVYLFMDGILLNPGGTAFSMTINSSSSPLKVGATAYDGTYVYAWPGNLDDVQFYNGVALHTASFTPPPSSFPNP